MNKVLNPRQYNPLHWCSVLAACKRRIPSEISDWLFDAGSLTRRLQTRCPGPFKVQLLRQFHSRPGLSERRVLAIPDHQRALIREVVLRVGNTPVVFARTVVPMSTLSGAQRRLAHLGENPLGAMLFADPNMSRTPMQVARISQGQSLYASAVTCLDEQPECVWGRRSVFFLGNKPLLVSEIFLPAIDRCER